MSLTDGVITTIPAPAGYVVDFANPQRNGDIAIYVVSGIGMTLSTLFMAQRLYVNFAVRRKLGLDDACLILAYGFIVAIQGIIIRAPALKFLGVHAWEMPITQFTEFVKYSVHLNPIVYAPPSALAKMVMLLFYLQLQNSQRLFKWSVYVTMFIVVGSNTGIFFSSIFACSPIAAGWDINVTGKCINRTALFEATAALGVIADVLIIMVPIPMVISLQMSTKKKAGLLFIFTIGLATVITSIVRLVLLITALGEVDETWGGGPVSVWIAVEGNLLIMCASLPTLRLFFKSVAPGFMSSSNGAGSKTTSGRLGVYGSRSRNTRRGLTALGSATDTSSNRNRQDCANFDDDNDYRLETMVVGGPRGKDLERDDTNMMKLIPTI